MAVTPSAVIPNKDFEPLDLDFHETENNLVNNGHTIEQEYEPGSKLVWEGVNYELLQFHFHTLSEHTVCGDRGVMEMHAVFRNELTRATWWSLVSFFESAARTRFWRSLITSCQRMEGDQVKDDDEINLAHGLEIITLCYTYPGSLITPP